MQLDLVTEKNLSAVLALVVHPSQTSFVATNAQSLAAAYVQPDVAWPRVCVVDGVPIGFVMLHIDSTSPDVYLWRLLIGAAHQRRGYGRAILDAVVAHGRSLPSKTRMVTSYVPGDGSPAAFYEAYGFRVTGEIDDGEVVLELPL